MQLRVHGVARELDVAAILYGKGLERDDGERVFHLAAVEGVAAGEGELVGGVVAHAQVAAAYQRDVVGVVGVEHAHDVGRLVDRHAQLHIQAANGGALHGL